MVKKLAVLCVASIVSVCTVASAVEIEVTITNLAESNGVALSPFFIGAHDGSFDAFDTGAAASTGIENIAELGNGSDLMTEFASAYPAGMSEIIKATSGAFGPGIYLPGGMGSMTLDLDPAMHRYVSYASMVVPSNDYFVGNDSPMAIELFDAGGNFTGGDVTVFASQIWDAGTEVDDPTNGPAFVMGQTITDGADEGGVVSLTGDLSTFDGVATPAEYDFTDVPTGNDAVARISFRVVPEPAGFALALLGSMALCLVRRRRVSL